MSSASLCVASVLRIFLRSTKEFHYPMLLNIHYFFAYFATSFLFASIPTLILFFMVRFLFRKFVNALYQEFVMFAMFVCVHSLVLEGMAWFAASFD